MKSLLTGTLLLTAFSALAQNDPIADYSKYIDATDLKKHLEVLASDEYEGRETGKKGQQMSAKYIQNSFKEDGCATVPGINGYEQFFKVVETTPGGDLKIFGKDLSFKKDFFYFGAKKKAAFDNLSVYTAEDFLKGKIINGAVISRLEGIEIRSKIEQLKKQAGTAKAIILVSDDYEKIYEYLEHYAVGKSMRLVEKENKPETPIIVVNPIALKGSLKKQYNYLLTGGKQKVSKSIAEVGKMSAILNKEDAELISSNVLCYIEGSDPVLSKEVVVMTAHYDHIGIDNGVVYNGADDDGTGTVALLEIAEAFQMAKKEGKGPKRSILIMTVSGEEKGLLGSSYYTDNPVIPLKNTIADLNIDMIGRNDIAHENESDYIYVIGSNMISNDLHNANEEANKQYTNLKLDYKFNSKTDPNQFYYRSDHYNFAKNGIPSVFYFSGIHEDYHQPTDDIEKINFAKVEKVARLVFATAWKLADAKERPVIN